MYQVDTIKDGTDLYYVIRDMEDLSILLSPTKYLNGNASEGASKRTGESPGRKQDIESGK